MKPQPSLSSARVNVIISNLLRWSVFASLVLLTVGTVLCFLNSPDYGGTGGSAADLQHLLHGQPQSIPLLANVIHGALHLQGVAVLLVGLVFLIATPIFRVVVSIVLFAVERDRVYAAITSVVLLLLFLSFYLGKVG